MAFQLNLWTSLVIYFFTNLSLSTSNKLVLTQTATPWVITSIHAIATFIGCLACLQRGVFTITKLTRRQNLTLAMFSSLFTLNIALSNISLSLVSLAFHQVARSTGPILTVLFYGLFFQKTYAVQIHLAILAMTVGIVLTTYGDYYFTSLGFVMTFAGVFTATVKTIMTNQLMTGDLKLSPLELLLRMCPLSALQALFCAYLMGELREPKVLFHTLKAHSYNVAFNASLALAQNLASFYTTRIAGALTIAVCANLKQSATVGLSIAWFRTDIGPAGVIGMLSVLAGSAFYSITIVRERARTGETSSKAHIRTISKEELGAAQ